MWVSGVGWGWGGGRVGGTNRTQKRAYVLTFHCGEHFIKACLSEFVIMIIWRFIYLFIYLGVGVGVATKIDREVTVTNISLWRTFY